MDAILEFKGQYRFLSNFWYIKIHYKGKDFETVEHAYQYSKCQSELDKQLILKCETPAQAKRLGRTVALVPDWEQIKVPVMKELLLIKFAEPNLQAKLLATGDALLQEGNWWGDQFWGVSLAKRKGENHLGRLLMEVREYYRAQK